MANLTQLDIVVQQTAGNNRQGTAGEQLTCGQPAYQSSVDNRWYRAKASGNSLQAGSQSAAIVLTNSFTGQPVSLFQIGQIQLGNSNLQVGQVYCMSNSVGAICPYSDLGTGAFVTVLGVAISATILNSPNGPFATGVQHF